MKWSREAQPPREHPRVITWVLLGVAFIDFAVDGVLLGAYAKHNIHPSATTVVVVIVLFVVSFGVGLLGGRSWAIDKGYPVRAWR